MTKNVFLKLYKSFRLLLKRFIINSLTSNDLIHPRVRPFIWKAVGINIESPYRVCIGPGSRITHGEILIEDGVFINAACLFVGVGKITLGENVQISPHVCFITSSHELGPASCRAGELESAHITVGGGTWIGANTTILPGATIGKGVVVGANSLVRENLEDNGLYAGSPARLIRQL